MANSQDFRCFAPTAARNRDAILEVLRGLLPACGLVLELASGTGEHIVHFASSIPDLTWQPSAPSLAARQSSAAWKASEQLPDILLSLEVDAERSPWPVR